MRKAIVIVSALIVLAAAAVFFLPRRPELKAAAAGAQAVSPAIVLYSGPDFTGRALRITGTLYDMPKVSDAEGDFDWNDQVQSLVVEAGTWRIYQHGRVNTHLDETAVEAFDAQTKPAVAGWSALVSGVSTGSLEIADLGAAGLMGDISSLELIAAGNLPDWTYQMRN